jgi:hypothetical protein
MTVDEDNNLISFNLTIDEVNNFVPFNLTIDENLLIDRYCRKDYCHDYDLSLNNDGKPVDYYVSGNFWFGLASDYCWGIPVIFVYL